MPIRFSCHECGKQLQTQDDFVGKKVRCPGCKIVLVVPGPDTAITSTPPESQSPTPTTSKQEGVRATSPVPRPRNEDKTTKPSTRSGRKKKKQSFPIVAILLLLILIGGGAGAFYYYNYYQNQSATKPPDVKTPGTNGEVTPGPEKTPVKKRFQFQASYEERNLGEAEKSHLDLIPLYEQALLTVRLKHALENLPSKFQDYLKAVPPQSHPLEWLKKNFGLHPKDIRRLSVVGGLTFTLNGPNPQALMFITTEHPYDAKKLRDQLVDDPTVKNQATGQPMLIREDFQPQGVPFKISMSFVDEKTFIVGDTESIKRVGKKENRAAEGGITKGLELARKNHAMVLSVRNSPILQQIGPSVLPPANPNNNEQAMGTAVAKEVLSLEAVDVVFDNDKEVFDVQLKVRFPNEQKAKMVKGLVEQFVLPALTMLEQTPKEQRPKVVTDALKSVLELIGQNPQGPPPAIKAAYIDLALEVLKGINLTQKGKLFQLGIVIKPATMTKVMALYPPVIAIKDAVAAMPPLPPLPSRPKKLNRQDLVARSLSALAIAAQNYHDTNKVFPSQSMGKGLSWRVALLPHIEQDALYQQFKLDEPWDSPNNKKLIGLMPDIFKHPTAKANPGHTYYQAVNGPGTIMEKGKKIKITMVKDGTSNTVLFLEGAKAVPWTKPEDVAYDGKKTPSFGVNSNGKVFVVLADGTVKILAKKFVQRHFGALVGRADGMPIPDLTKGKPNPPPKKKGGPGPKKEPTKKGPAKKNPGPGPKEPIKKGSGAKQPQPKTNQVSSIDAQMNRAEQSFRFEKRLAFAVVKKYA